MVLYHDLFPFAFAFAFAFALVFALYLDASCIGHNIEARHLRYKFERQA